ncbi:MAG: family 16 glycosylhydrolase [Prolixibacteraceae bacterium]
MKKIGSIVILLLLFTALYAQKPYKGAEVYSRGKVLYGKFEMHMKMIKGSGMLSTFYTIEQSSDNEDYNWEELDIEVLGKNNAQIMSTNIFTDDENGDLVHSPQEILLDYSLADDFHTFTLEWTPNYVAWFIDGLEQRRETGDVVNDLDLPQGYRFNAWISSSPGWVGSIDREALPRFQYIDWVEYYSYNDSSEDFTLEWRDDFNTFNSSRWAKAQWTFNGNEVDFVKENAFIEDGKLVLAITDPNPPVGISEKGINTDFSANYSADSNEIVINCFEEGVHEFKLCDVSGKVQFSKQFDTTSFSFSCSTIKKGLYILCVRNNGIWSEKKIVVE